MCRLDERREKEEGAIRKYKAIRLKKREKRNWQNSWGERVKSRVFLPQRDACVIGVAYLFLNIPSLFDAKQPTILAGEVEREIKSEEYEKKSAKSTPLSL